MTGHYCLPVRGLRVGAEVCLSVTLISSARDPIWISIGSFSLSLALASGVSCVHVSCPFQWLRQATFQHEERTDRRTCFCAVPTGDAGADAALFASSIGTFARSPPTPRPTPHHTTPHHSTPLHARHHTTPHHTTPLHTPAHSSHSPKAASTCFGQTNKKSNVSSFLRLVFMPVAIRDRWHGVRLLSSLLRSSSVWLPRRPPPPFARGSVPHRRAAPTQSACFPGTHTHTRATFLPPLFLPTTPPTHTHTHTHTRAILPPPPCLPVTPPRPQRRRPLRSIKSQRQRQTRATTRRFPLTRHSAWPPVRPTGPAPSR